MKFGRQLLDHIRQCESKDDPCLRSDYVDYKFLKKQIRRGIPEGLFQELYAAELEKLTAGLRSGLPLKRDPQYADINRMALDKISKKFDKRLHGHIRFANWQATTADIGKVLGAFQVNDAFIPPDVRLKGSAAQPSSMLIFSAGAFSGIVSRTCTAPLDRIKIMLQAGNAPNMDGQKAPHRWENKGIMGGRIAGAAHAIHRDGGIRAFWQGNGANVLKVMPESAVKFCVYDNAQERISDWSADNDLEFPVSERFLAGSLAGCISQAVVYPLDVTKTRMAASPSGTYDGISHCLRNTLAKEGIQALFKGIGPATLSIIPASGIDLTVYNTAKVHYSARKQDGDAKEIPIAIALCFGAISCTCGAVVSYPLTVVRTRLIVQGMPGRPIKYSGMMDCLQQLRSKNGIFGLYRGLTPALLKAVPAVSIGYGAFETAKRFGKTLA